VLSVNSQHLSLFAFSEMNIVECEANRAVQVVVRELDFRHGLHQKKKL